jgi:hypothetical protein
VFGGFAHRAVDVFDRLAEILVVADDPPAGCIASGLAVLVKHVDQVDIAGDVELAGAQLAHADHPHLGPLRMTIGVGALRRTVEGVQVFKGKCAGGIEGEFGQFGDGAGDGFQ